MRTLENMRKFSKIAAVEHEPELKHLAGVINWTTGSLPIPSWLQGAAIALYSRTLKKKKKNKHASSHLISS